MRTGDDNHSAIHRQIVDQIQPHVIEVRCRHREEPIRSLCCSHIDGLNHCSFLCTTEPQNDLGYVPNK